MPNIDTKGMKVTDLTEQQFAQLREMEHSYFYKWEFHFSASVGVESRRSLDVQL